MGRGMPYASEVTALHSQAQKYSDHLSCIVPCNLPVRSHHSSMWWSAAFLRVAVQTYSMDLGKMQLNDNHQDRPVSEGKGGSILLHIDNGIYTV